MTLQTTFSTSDSSDNADDQLGTVPWDTQTNEYNAAGVVTRSTQVDGAGDDADYASRTTAYDIQGRIDSIDVRRDDGTRDSTDHDQNSTQAWSRVESHFDTQDRQDHATAFIDDGSWSFYDYDQTNARGDRTWQTHVDAQGRTDWTNVIQDDGSVDFYVPPNAAPLNPFVPSPFAPFYFQEPPVPAPEWDLEVDVRIPESEPYV